MASACINPLENTLYTELIDIFLPLLYACTESIGCVFVAPYVNHTNLVFYIYVLADMSE